jgi:hypothetical protein
MLTRMLKISTLLYPTNMYENTYNKDSFKYRSLLRKRFIDNQNLNGLVESHHIIPKQYKMHDIFSRVKFDIDDSYNLFILPKWSYAKRYDDYYLIHQNGHKKYDAYVKCNLDKLMICSTEDILKYNFWLFHNHLRNNMIKKNCIIPWR